ncbi:MAG: HAMP domain-containing sensor histidine kinase [Cellvibrionaceae bacterium]
MNTDIGSPPDINKADELSKELSINIYIYGQDINYSSTGIPLDLDEVDLYRDHHKDHHYNKKRKPFNKTRKSEMWGNNNISFGEHDDRSILLSEVGGYKIYYELPRRDSRKLEIIRNTILLLLLIIIVSYLILRHMLKPIQDIKKGVINMSKGDLAYRVPLRKQNDLGELASNINTMAQDIEQMLDAKRQLLLALSHELRSPLTRAKIATEMLDTSNNRDRIIEDLQEMESLITEILDAEKINSPHTALNKTTLEIKSLTQSILDELSADSITINAPEKLPLINADETRIRLLLRNLINNALAYSAKTDKAPLITINKKGRLIAIQVIDYGQGIPSTEINKVTEPFYRLDPSRTRSTGGFGLGLYLCKLITEAHKGTLSIDSELGNGTTITITLPY